MASQQHRKVLAARGALARALAVVMVWVVLGAVVLTLIEGWTFFRSLFFVLITVTTVGYGDEGVSEVGRWVTIVLMLGGIGGTTYAFALMVQVVLAHGADWRWRMLQKIARLEGHVVVLGFGRMGRALAEEVAASGHTVVVIDEDLEHADEAREAGFLFIEGDATEEQCLVSAGVSRAAQVAVCLDRTELSLVAVLSARDLTADARIVARVHHPNEERRMRLAGADEVVSPLHAGALDAARLLIRPDVTELLTNHLSVGMDLGVGELRIEAGSPLVGRTIADVGSTDTPSVSFIAIVRKGQHNAVRPTASQALVVGDTLVLVGESAEVQWLVSANRNRRAA